MHRIGWSLVAASAILLAADPAWKSKPIAQWTAEDARQLLAGSPWTKPTILGILPQRGEDQLREGGKMGGGGQRAGLGQIDRQVLSGARKETVFVRWESAGPVRAAEIMAAETDAPNWDGDYLVVAVYDVPGVTPSVQKLLLGQLKQTSSLKCAGKKDLKPERVEIGLVAGNRARILYLFPRSADYAADDRSLEFVSQIGRIYVAQTFTTGDMWFQGKLEM